MSGVFFVCMKGPETLLSFSASLFSGEGDVWGADKARLKVKPEQSGAQEGNRALTVLPDGFGFTHVITRGL